MDRQSERVAEFTRRRNNRNKLYRLIAVMGLLVVAFTAFMLIRPAITMEGQAKILNCQYTVHQHDDSCYKENADGEKELVCGKADYVIHEHEESCYDSSGKLICPLNAVSPEEAELHTHTEDCYDESGDLTCDKLEVLAHTHGDECFETADSTQTASEEFTLTAKTDSGITVTVTGPADALPYPADEITVTVEEITDEESEDIRDKALKEDNLKAAENYLFDVCLWHDGEEIEPTSELTLSFSGLPLENGNKTVVYHIDKEKQDAVNMDAVTDDKDNVVLDTDHFSTYSVSLLAASVNESGEYSLTAHVVTTDGTDGTDGMYEADDDSKYLLLAHEDGKFYALDGDGNAVALGSHTVTKGEKVNYTGTAEQIDNLCWTISDKEKDPNNELHRRMYIKNQRYDKSLYPNNESGLFKTGSKKVNLWLQKENNSNFAATIYPDSPDNTRIGFGSGKIFHTYVNGAGAESEAWIFFAKVESLDYCHVWLDGTDGGLMSLGGASDDCQIVNKNSTITLPEKSDSPAKYSYKLKGWYDIKASKYYKCGAEVTITQDTVFYADWEPVTYDIGQDNENTVQSLNTNAFITTHVFDYGALFNVQSTNADTDISGASHEEKWSLTDSSAYNTSSLNFIFRDWDTYDKSISYPVGSETWEGETKQPNPNDNNPDIYSELCNNNLIDILFRPESDIIGKKYVGTGNYLYQYDDETGYYYYDSKKNAASYNQSNSRFYIYDYLERTSDSPKDSETEARGKYSDFLPFNSPDKNTNGKTVIPYKENGKSGYQYDAKYDSTEGGIACTPENAGTNYWFGMSSSIRFYLPNDSDSNGTGRLNQSTKNADMEFKFSGDDDVWVFVDNELVLDIGGLHGVEEGTINFSNGKVWRSTGAGEGETIQNSFLAGEHTLTVYYLERGGSQSNCAIYFNIAPRDYSLELTKTSRNDESIKLAGAEFTIYSDMNCTDVVEGLKNAEGANTSTFTSGEDGRINCYGLQPGEKYYIKETKAPPGYNGNENVIIELSIAGIEQSYKVTSKLYVDGKEVQIDDKNSNIYLTEDKSTTGGDRTVKYIFTNEPGYALPETGGMGTLPFTIAGIILILGAGAILYRTRLRRRED